MKKPLIILTGPTAVGKTELSVRLAKLTGGEIISADSCQVYKGMDIGSAKITPDEMQEVPHYLIDELDPDEEFHVVKFQQLAKEYMEKIYAKGKIPILTGGTGFYIQAVLYDIDFTENGEDREYRRLLEREASEKGADYLHEKLCSVDPCSGALIHPNNTKRIIRALEYYQETGQPISEHNELERKKESPYNFLYFVLNDEREKVYQRIEKRVDRMLHEGLLQEVAGLREKGYGRDLVSMQGLGYKEILEYFDEEISLEEAIRVIKRDTRHFAKRQLTWFKREPDVIWLNRQEFANGDDILDNMCREMEKRGIRHSEKE